MHDPRRRCTAWDSEVCAHVDVGTLHYGATIHTAWRSNAPMLITTGNAPRAYPGSMRTMMTAAHAPHPRRRHGCAGLPRAAGRSVPEPPCLVHLSDRSHADGSAPRLAVLESAELPAVAQLEAVVRTEQAVFGEFAFTPEEQQLYTEGVEAITAGTARALATTYDFARPRRRRAGASAAGGQSRGDTAAGRGGRLLHRPAAE